METPRFFSFQNTKDILLQNEKLMQAQEEKVQILVAISTSLPAIAEKATLLQAAGVPNPDNSIITRQPLACQRNLGHPLGGTPQGPRTFVGASVPPPHQITPDFLHPLDLPANCLVVSDTDSASIAEAGSDSKNGSERECNDICPPPFQHSGCDS